METFSLEIPPLGQVIEQDAPVQQRIERDLHHPTLFDLGELATAQIVEL